jgi:hypothetical protein
MTLIEEWNAVMAFPIARGLLAIAVVALMVVSVMAMALADASRGRERRRPERKDIS